MILLSASLTTAISQEAKALTLGVELGDASSFAVLAGTGITNTGDTNALSSAAADFGSSPTPAFTGSGSVQTNGTKHLAVNDVTVAAKEALDTAYADAAGRTPDTMLSMEIGSETLGPGVHRSASSIGISGTLTLDAAGDPAAVFIFQATSTLITAVASEVILANGAQACNVFWQVGSSATIGVNSKFSGKVMAHTSITANAGATIQGQLLARGGAVTLDNNTFNNDQCASSYEVSFDTQLGSTVDTQNVATLVEASTTRSGYEFQGWFTEASAGSKISLPYSPDSDITLFAQWLESHEVTFETNSGSVVAMQDVATLLTADTTRVGYAFLGWFDASVDGSEVNLPYSPTAPISLYAYWVPVFTITFDVHSGSAVDSQEVAILTQADTTRAGYALLGWFTAATGGQEIALPYTPDADLTAHAQWINLALRGVPVEDLPEPRVITFDPSQMSSNVEPQADGGSTTLEIPAGALQTGTVLELYTISSSTFLQEQIDPSFEYLTNQAVIWSAADGSVVPSSQPLTMKMAGPKLVIGARIFKTTNQITTQIGTVTEQGQATLTLSENQMVTVAITPPDAPNSVTVTSVGITEATLSWPESTATGGSEISGYTVTSSGGQSCTTTTLSCQITGLREDTTYTFSAIATNSIGSSPSGPVSSEVTSLKSAANSSGSVSTPQPAIDPTSPPVAETPEPEQDQEDSVTPEPTPVPAAPEQTADEVAPEPEPVTAAPGLTADEVAPTQGSVPPAADQVESGNQVPAENPVVPTPATFGGYYSEGPPNNTRTPVCSGVTNPPGFSTTPILIPDTSSDSPAATNICWTYIFERAESSDEKRSGTSSENSFTEIALLGERLVLDATLISRAMPFGVGGLMAPSWLAAILEG